MRKQQSNAEMVAHISAAPRSMNRRSFLKAATSGVAALALSGSGETTQAANQSAPVAMQAASPDFTTLAEDWNEPWVWRPGDWPRDQLQLNVVSHAAPMAVFSDNVQPGVQQLLFSYGGISPGPTIRMKGNETLYIKVRNLLPANVDPCAPEHSEGPHQQHTIRLPRNGGRVVFRARFWDYAGCYVNHCHILEHEDHGMMQQVEVVDDAPFADYVAQKPGYAWPPMTRQECYKRDLAGGGDSHH